MASASADCIDPADAAPGAVPEPAPAGSDLAFLVERYADGVVSADMSGGEPTVVVERTTLVEAVRALRDERGYQLLRSLTALDFWPREPRFQLVVHMLAIPPEVLSGHPVPDDRDEPRTMRLTCAIPGSDAVVDSLTGLYPAADWLEREVWDMFGIEFSGHPDLRRLLNPDDLAGHPLRKDFPLTYEPVAFTHNADAMQRAKPKAED
jgi:NADH-quinone oxidoreductase subunit C